MRRNDSGATAVELVLVLPIALLLIFVTLTGCMYYYYSAVAAHVARAVAHDAAMPDHGRYPAESDELAVADDATGTLMPKPASVDLAASPRVGEGNTLTVTVVYDLPLMRTLDGLPFMPHFSDRLVRSVSVRYE